VSRFQEGVRDSSLAQLVRRLRLKIERSRPDLSLSRQCPNAVTSSGQATQADRCPGAARPEVLDENALGSF